MQLFECMSHTGVGGKSIEWYSSRTGARVLTLVRVIRNALAPLEAGQKPAPSTWKWKLASDFFLNPRNHEQLSVVQPGERSSFIFEPNQPKPSCAISLDNSGRAATHCPLLFCVPCQRFILGSTW